MRAKTVRVDRREKTPARTAQDKIKRRTPADRIFAGVFCTGNKDKKHPCFYTDTDFYLIPDGSGNWKKTDPRIDNERITDINQKHNGKLLELVRLAKYWNNRKVTIRIGSYLLECMILQKYESKEASEKWWIDLEFRDLLKYLSSAILSDVDDPKGIQGNLNSFCWDDRCKISDALTNVYNKAVEASSKELNDKDQKGAIMKWREVLGNDFPEYTGE